MERIIDRTSYRRNARREVKKIEEEKTRFSFIRLFLNQTIVSLLIIIFVLVARFFDVDVVIEWIKDNTANGYTVTEVFGLLKNNLYKDEIYNLSGENFLESGENFLESGDISGEDELMTAVEGINQMAEDATYVKENYDFILPLKGVITSEFGCRVSNSEIVSSYHTGIDIAANSGTQILAMHDGTVTMAKNFSSYGNCIIIENGDLVSLYAHCLSLNVKEGQNVKKGDFIGKVGMTGNATGPHLHLEVKYQGRYVNPKDVLGII